MPFSEELCKNIPNGLIGQIKAKTERLSFEQIETDLSYLSLQNGGKRRPNIETIPNYKLAIIVPYRDRLVNLKLFINYIHPFLNAQNIYYGIYVVEPIGNLTFNKGVSMNAGFIEALKEDNWDCFIFHDVDIIPENPKNVYNCNAASPKLLAVAISAFGYSVNGYFKDKYFGGATGFTKEQFIKVNGFSNLYFGWGLEDDDARERVLNKFSSIARIPADIGRYYANCHEQQTRNPNRFIIYIKSFTRQETDGLNTVKYEVVTKEKNSLFTRIYISYKNNT